MALVVILCGLTSPLPRLGCARWINRFSEKDAGNLGESFDFGQQRYTVSQSVICVRLRLEYHKYSHPATSIYARENVMRKQFLICLALLLALCLPAIAAQDSGKAVSPARCKPNRIASSEPVRRDVTDAGSGDSTICACFYANPAEQS